MPKSLIDQKWDFANKPVGTGPFVLKEFTRDSRIVLEKNPKYWMPGLPKLDRVVMNIITDRAVQVQGLVSGAIDAVEFVDPVDFPVLKASKDVVIDKSLSSLIMVMAMNCTDPVLSNLKVRQAVNYAVDKQQVLDIAYGGGKVIGTFMDADNAYYKNFTSLYKYNPEKAKALLAEAKIPAGTVFEMVLPSNYDMHVKAGQMYQEMLKKVGLTVNIKLVDWPTWLSDVYSGGKYDFTVISHTGKLDPDGTLGGYGGGKYVKWTSKECLDLINRGEADCRRRRAQAPVRRGHGDHGEGGALRVPRHLVPLQGVPLERVRVPDDPDARHLRFPLDRQAVIRARGRGSLAFTLSVLFLLILGAAALAAPLIAPREPDRPGPGRPLLAAGRRLPAGQRRPGPRHPEPDHLRLTVRAARGHRVGQHRGRARDERGPRRGPRAHGGGQRRHAPHGRPPLVPHGAPGHHGGLVPRLRPAAGDDRHRRHLQPDVRAHRARRDARHQDRGVRGRFPRAGHAPFP